MKAASAVLPGSTLGVLGSGQLGRMFAMAAKRMGYRVHVFAPEEDGPARAFCDQYTCASYEDKVQLQAFAAQCQAVTLEFENVPVAAVEAVDEITPVRPGARVLATTQNRLKEKQFLQESGIPVVPFAHVKSAGDLVSALAQLGVPVVLKTCESGYDGKGQQLVTTADHAPAAVRALGDREAVAEGFVDIEKEFSIIGARSAAGGAQAQMALFPPVENVHRNHILDVSSLPAQLPPPAIEKAVDFTRRILVGLDVVGLLAVEFFLTRGGAVFVNELAPRPHNSGHLTMESAPTSQFEQQVRAIAGLGLGATEPCRPAAMANLLGDLWAAGEPDWQKALSLPDVHLHLYGKKDARAGRKMGHLTALAESQGEALALAEKARNGLVGARVSG